MKPGRYNVLPNQTRPSTVGKHHKHRLADGKKGDPRCTTAGHKCDDTPSWTQSTHRHIFKSPVEQIVKTFEQKVENA